MSGPITPHIEITSHPDGVHLRLKHVEIVLPPDMAKEVGKRLIAAADDYDPLNVTPLPIVKPKGDPL